MIAETGREASFATALLRGYLEPGAPLVAPVCRPVHAVGAEGELREVGRRGRIGLASRVHHTAGMYQVFDELLMR